MFDHVVISVSDREASERFYDTVLPTVGVEKDWSGEHFAAWGKFFIAADSERPVTRRLHIAFSAPSREHVDEFWRAGTEAGYRDDGPPGLRPQYSEDYYGSFVRDPDGNSIEAVHFGATREVGSIDHVWMRVADVAAAKRFYELVAPHGGFHLGHDSPDRARFVTDAGSFSVVSGEPTEHAHLAFPGAGNAVVDAFHAEATAAGYRDNGPPGKRPIYHAGYYGAFVLDPDGNNIEVVNHNRG